MVYLRLRLKVPCDVIRLANSPLKVQFQNLPTLSNITVIDCTTTFMIIILLQQHFTTSYSRCLKNDISNVKHKILMPSWKYYRNRKKKKKNILRYIRTKNYAHMLASFLLYLFPSYIFLRVCSKKLTMFAMKRKKCLS